MKRMTGGAALVATILAFAPLHAEAQQPRMGQRGAAMGQRGAAMGPRGAGVEMILRQRERLELTEDQVGRLDRIRQQAVERRTAHQAQIAEIRSKVAAGQMERDELREQVQALRDGFEGVRTQEREQVEAILTEAQRETLQQWGAQARAFRMGRASALRGQQGRFGPDRGERGMAPRRFGDGFGPGFRGDVGPRKRQRWMPGAQGRFNRRGGPGA